MIKTLIDRFTSREPEAPQYDTPEPSLWSPVSQACTQAQFEEPQYSYWCAEFREAPRMHRKQWEFCYILQALKSYDMLHEGKRALGFGVGKEPIPAILANHGISVLGTDLAPDAAADKGWIETQQHSQSKLGLNERGICDPDTFDRLVDFRFMDMNKIDVGLRGWFDIVWSACAFEHLGSIMQGLEFVVESARCLRPGGLAIHTTEFNCSSDDETIDHASTVLFRKRDFLELQKKLAAMGCEMEFNFNLGTQPLDLHIDIAPYSVDEHLKLEIMDWTVTSFGLIVKKRGAGQ